MNPRCDVIIPVKDEITWAEKCLEELFRCTDPVLLGKVLVVNDHSSRESSIALEEVCSRFQSVELLENLGGPGFGGACNFAAERCEAPYLLFLNTDCLLTPRTVEKLVQACEQDASIGLACPLSNNSPVLTVPMMPGRSYLEMNELLERINRGRASSEVVLDACTVVGNCLLISRKCWEATGAFGQTWGLGYGEETDFQFRAMRRGFRGVALINAYVFHFGNASFRYQAGFAELQKRNLELFHSKWGPDFVEYQKRCSKHDPVQTVETRLKEAVGEAITADVLFVLPGISQTIGGVHVVIEICNFLIRHGINAKCLVLGALEQSALESYTEPILFGLLNYSDEPSLLADDSIDTRIVVATLFSTAVPAYLFARMRDVPLVNFVQGYEFLFDNGSVRDRVEQSYALPDWVMVTSSWLEAGVRRRTPEKPISVLPIGVDPYLFLPSAEATSRAKVRIAVFLRSAADKGQAVLLEMLDQLLPYRDRISLTVFSTEQPVPREWFQSKDTELVRTPSGKGTLARYLRRCDILIDASLHEGFGLVPLEAMACGLTVVASDSGGINEFLKDRQNGLLVKEVNKAERFVTETLKLVHDRQLLKVLQRGALDTARRYSASVCYQRYAEYFENRLKELRRWRAEPPVVSWKSGESGIRVIRDLIPIKDASWVLRPKGRQSSLTIPSHAIPAGTVPVVKLDIFSSGQQTLDVSYGEAAAPTAGSVPGDLMSYLRSAALRLQELGSITGLLGSLPLLSSEQERLRVQVKKGWNELLVELPQQSMHGPLRLILGGRRESVLSALQIRGVRPSEEATVSLKERFEASDAIGWELRLATRPDVVTDGVELLPWPSGHFRSLGDDPGLLLPDVPWPWDRTLIGWIDFSVPVETTAQLFYLTGSMTNYTEEASIRRIARRGRNIFSVNLTANLTGRLRFDPGEVRGEYQIHSCRLYSRRPRTDLATLTAQSA